ncbi:unnamed protein product [Microthlaspi erraticum]|uniref:Uncharacterized protein n=1 Tax=Microthlaspi erraticum TaxID=1685480 RepID=A0A6D2J5K0_9BRAS|nr:unnamed protein product [Microthlaspi erraticum]
MASREVSTMIKQGFISDPPLSFSPSRTTSLSKPPISSPPPSPNDSTRSRRSNPTLLDMISDEHNRETRRYQDEPRRKYHAAWPRSWRISRTAWDLATRS